MEEAGLKPYPEHKPGLENIEGLREQLLCNVLGGIFENWLYGVHNSHDAQPEAALGKKMLESASRHMRMAGRYLVEAYEVTERDVAIIAYNISDHHLPFGGVVAAGDWIRARLGEGIHDAGQQELAQQIANSPYIHPGYKEEMEQYFQEHPVRNPGL